MTSLLIGRLELTRGGSLPRQKENIMLWSIAVILILLWAFGLVTSYTLGGFIHVLIALAIVSLLLGIIQGRRGRYIVKE